MSIVFGGQTLWPPPGYKNGHKLSLITIVEGGIDAESRAMKVHGGQWCLIPIDYNEEGLYALAQC